MQPSAAQIRRQFIDFFVKRVPDKLRHTEIVSASLIPENDPTVLFTTAGMHPLVPFLVGEPHPAGKRLVDAQKCLRTDDIDEVGDATHLTFFEMLGNWSLGDYFKEEAIKMSFDLLTLPWEHGGYGLNVDRLSVSCFEGDKDAPRDTESAEVWLKQKTADGKSIPSARIYFFPKKKNWWGPAGTMGPCGPDTEMFYDVCFDMPGFKEELTKHNPASVVPAEKLPTKCDASCDCGRYVEVWNDVFMQYYKKEDGSFEPLKQKNVDTGLGFERITGILHGKPSHYETELFWPAVKKILELANMPHEDGKIPQAVTQSVRIIADHLRAATFVLGDPQGVSPSNVDQGYIVRRLIRRAIRHGRQIGIAENFTAKIAQEYIPIYKDVYSELEKNQQKIFDELNREEEKFMRTLEKGLREVKKYIDRSEQVTGEKAFYIFETYGFPIEMIMEELKNAGANFDPKEIKQGFDAKFKEHQAKSRVGAEQKFAGGLADHSEQCKMHHTATHLVHQALRTVLGNHVFQRGSNITKERLRFDFSQDVKMTPEQIKQVEDLVNEQIKLDLPIHFEILELSDAKSRGVIGVFDDKYAQLGNKVKVYFMGPPANKDALTGAERDKATFSKEVCGGPHVEHTGVLKHFKILKEEACSAGVRRIKAVAEGIKDVA